MKQLMPWIVLPNLILGFHNPPPQRQGYFNNVS